MRDQGLHQGKLLSWCNHLALGVVFKNICRSQQREVTVMECYGNVLPSGVSLALRLLGLLGDVIRYLGHGKRSVALGNGS